MLAKDIQQWQRTLGRYGIGAVKSTGLAMFSVQAISTLRSVVAVDYGEPADLAASFVLAANRGVGDSASDGKETVPAAFFFGSWG